MKPEVTYRGRIIEIVQFEGKPGVMFEKAVRAPGTRLIIETEKDGRKALASGDMRQMDMTFDYLEEKSLIP
jgi:hypothetical protein